MTGRSFYFSFVVLLICWGCNQTPKPGVQVSNADSVRIAESGLDSAAIEAAPDWFITLPEADSVFYAVATATSARANIARDKAVMKAQVELAQQVKSRTSPGGAEMGERTSGELNVTLENVSVAKQFQVQDGKLWRVYVLLEMKK